MPEIGNWSINRLLSTAARMLEHSWNNQLKELGLTHAGVTALGVIAREGTVSQVRVASIVGVQAQTMGKTLARLEAHGHVFRTRNNVDRRSYLLGITATGREVLAKAEEIDQRLAAAGELADPVFREMLVRIVMELAEQEGNDALLKGAQEHHETSVGFVEYTKAPSDELIERVQTAAQERATRGEEPAVTTTVMDVITDEMIAKHRLSLIHI